MIEEGGKEDAAAKRESMIAALEKSGRGVKVEKKQIVVGNNTEFALTSQNGAKSDVKINNETSEVEVRGEQKELKGMVESGDITNVNQAGNNLSDVQNEAINLINSSNLSPEQKQAEIARVQAQDFSKNTQANQQYLEQVKGKMAELENKRKELGVEEPNAMEQTFNEITGRKPAKEERKPAVATTLSPELRKMAAELGVEKK
ncbi:MAG: hypothetical protein LBR70_01300 [Lactobacillaceae bacterium]|jgi:hypothetical protein|nr:hypothetical protein [Lactobacillaceae bacterium]